MRWRITLLEENGIPRVRSDPRGPLVSHWQRSVRAQFRAEGWLEAYGGRNRQGMPGVAERTSPSFALESFRKLSGC